jgi:hypothetical protein
MIQKERGPKSYPGKRYRQAPYLQISKAHAVRERLPIILVGIIKLAVFLSKNNSLRYNYLFIIYILFVYIGFVQFKFIKYQLHVTL